MSKDFVERLKSRLDIVEVLSGYISLKRAGRNYKAVCPFHNEKTPSFVVSPDKQVFHCFGCGAGGDVVGFVMKYESLGFTEAVRGLAEKAGLDPGDFAPGEKRGGAYDRKRLFAMLKEAAEFYSQNLERAPSARNYLEKRGVDAGSIGKFNLGYAPAGWGALSNHLKGRGFDEETVLASGICRRGQGAGSGQKLYDMLRDRVVFPIKETGGQVIAFGGRITGAGGAGDNSRGEAQPKYLNTADSPVFKKGETLYGMDLAREAVRKKGYLVLCEGYLDVIICHQYGFENTAAPLGTAFGAAHLRKLKRQTNRLVFVFDGDQAGLNAAKRSIGLALDQDFRVKVALLPEGFDPDTLLRERGPLAFKKILGSSLTPVEFVLKTTKGPRVDAIKEAAGLLGRIEDPIAREEFIRELSERGKIRESAIRQEMGRLGRGDKKAPGDIIGPGARGDDFRYNEETLLLSVFVNLPGKREKILQETNGLEGVEAPLVRALIFRLKDGQAGGPEDWKAETFSDEEQSLLSRVSITPGFLPEEADQTIGGCVRKLRLRAIEKKISEACGDVNLLKGLYRDKEALKGGNLRYGERTHGE
ncbi:MAG: DNA primase [Nitrospiraceae bacterium]|nr:DNA primase [Nitrospiraceae bacterium]